MDANETDTGMLTADDRRKARDCARILLVVLDVDLSNQALAAREDRVRDGLCAEEIRDIAAAIRDIAAAIRDLDAVARGPVTP